MGLSFKRNGQSLVEYTLVVAIIGAAVVAMSTYVYRAVQAQTREISAEFQEQ